MALVLHACLIGLHHYRPSDYFWILDLEAVSDRGVVHGNLDRSDVYLHYLPSPKPLHNWKVFTGQSLPQSGYGK